MNIFSLFCKYHYNAKQLRIKVENTCSAKFWNRVNLTLRMPEPLGSTGHKQRLPFPVKDTTGQNFCYKIVLHQSDIIICDVLQQKEKMKNSKFLFTVLKKINKQGQCNCTL